MGSCGTTFVARSGRRNEESRREAVVRSRAPGVSVSRRDRPLALLAGGRARRVKEPAGAGWTGASRERPTFLARMRCVDETFGRALVDTT
jgi:hypothetical protein